MDEQGFISQMSYHSANPRKCRRSHLYRKNGRRGTWASAQHAHAGGGQDDPDGQPDDPGFRNPDGPGGGPDEAKWRGVSVAARKSGWGSGCPVICLRCIYFSKHFCPCFGL